MWQTSRLRTRFLAACLLIVSALGPTLTANPAWAYLANPTESCVGLSCKLNFPTTNGTYAWVVPRSDTYTLEVWGAQGGNASPNLGGAGGYSKGDKYLTAGQTLFITIGGQGTSSGSGISDRLLGGYNGGGYGNNGNSTSYRGSGGGGATDIRLDALALTDRIIVAGAGGGAYWMSGGTSIPGVGGGLSGGTGVSTGGASASGGGGTQSAGGAGGAYFIQTSPGSLGLGGTIEMSTYGGPGGGAGYYGGGAGGSTQASGGGSGYIGGVSNGSTIAGNLTIPNWAGGTSTGNTGDGYARISYTKSASPVTFSLSLPNNTIQAYKGVKLTLTAATSQAGKITFYADGKKIPGCISLVTSIGNKTCDWKPASRRNVTITATYTPTSILYLSAVAQINVGVSQRSTFR